MGKSKGRTIEEPRREIEVRDDVDIVVCGGGSAGMAAALAAARAGMKVILVERHGFLGGAATAAGVNGLGGWHYDVDGKPLIRGIPMEIMRRLAGNGGAIREWVNRLNKPEISREGLPYIFYGIGCYWIHTHPEHMKLAMDEMMQEANVGLLYHCLAVLPIMEGKDVRGVIVESKSGRQAILAKVVVDCTGDGDVAARAGATVEKGDEQIGRNRHFLGIGMTDITALARKRGEWDIPRERISFISTMRDDEVAVNMTRVPDVDAVDSLSLSAAELTARAQINQVVSLLRKYVPGFERARLNASSPKIGIRETRRIIGDYVLTGEDVLEGRRFADEVLLAGYFVDIHHPDREGCTNIKPKGAYGIPYRCLVPLGVDNLLVAGRCLSAIHEGQAAARVMVTCMAMGEAAGCAAAMACQQNVTPRELNVGQLRERLIEQGAVLSI